jgi:ribosome maturation factor RimP
LLKFGLCGKILFSGEASFVYVEWVSCPLFILENMAIDETGVIEKIRNLASPAAESLKLELVHIEIAGTRAKKVVRIFIDKPGGVTIEDCADLSRLLDVSLDAEDLFAGPYVLEVSSPGLDRELYSIADFARFAGNLAKIRIKPESELPKLLIGRIVAVAGDDIVFDDREAGKVTIPYSKVAKANLKVDLEEEFARSRKRERKAGI